MKTKTLLILAMIAASLALTACDSTKDDETAQLKEQISQLEQQVQDLQEGSIKDPSGDISVPSENTPDGAAVSETPVSQTPAADDIHYDGYRQQQSTSAVPDITTLSARIQDLEQRVEDMTPAGSAQEQWEQYTPLEQEIESLEQDLDRLEDALELQYETGILDPASYREDGQTIELLEDRLDQCGDQLEFKFKIS